MRIISIIKKIIFSSYIPENKKLDDLLTEFKTKKIHGYEINKSLFQLAKIFNQNSKLSNEYL